jgi:hypothetical protein
LAFFAWTCSRRERPAETELVDAALSLPAQAPDAAEAITPLAEAEFVNADETAVMRIL